MAKGGPFYRPDKTSAGLVLEGVCAASIHFSWGLGIWGTAAHPHRGVSAAQDPWDMLPRLPCPDVPRQLISGSCDVRKNACFCASF